MTALNYDTMSLDDLRQYVLAHREDVDAFHAYIDRSKTGGRMISINLSDSHWEESMVERIRQMTSDEG